MTRMFNSVLRMRNYAE